MADAGLDIVALHVRPDTAAQFLRSQGLADAANVIALAFNSDDMHAGTKHLQKGDDVIDKCRAATSRNASTSAPSGALGVAPPLRLFKVQQRTERRPMNRCLAYPGEPAADIDGVNSEGRPTVAQPCAGNELANGRPSPMKPSARHSRERVRERGCGHVGKSLHRSSHVGISLKVLIDHWASPTGLSWHEGCMSAV
jgi:hypothetical protein